jgi:hypothetical protein
MRRDDHGVEQSSRADIVREAIARAALRVFELQIQPAHIQEAANRPRLTRAIVRDDHANARGSG